MRGAAGRRSFRYRAISGRGQLLRGELAAADRQEATRRLQAEGHFPIEVEPAAPGAAVPWWRREITLGGGVPAGLLARFARELGTLLEAGLAVDRALALTAETLPPSPLKRALPAVREAVREGAGLAEALQQHPRLFPRLVVGLARAGEAAGALPAVLLRLAEHLERAQALRESLRSALLYPALLSVLALASLVFILLGVLPQFRPLLEGSGAELPWTSELLFAASGLLDAFWLEGLLALLLLALLGVLAWRRPAARAAGYRAAGRLPLLGALLREAEGARFARALSLLLGSGLPMTQALAVAQQTQQSPVNAAAVEAVGERVRQGVGLAAALGAAGAFPALLVELARIGEESGKLAALLGHAAEILERDLRRKLDRLVTILTPALTILLGLVIGGLIASVFAALLSVNELAL